MKEGIGGGGGKGGDEEDGTIEGKEEGGDRMVRRKDRKIEGKGRDRED